MSEAGRKPDDSRLEIGPPSLDQAVAELAARQHGVVATRQLAALGIAQRAVSHRVAAGRLHRIHHGVYAVGHRVLTRHGRWMAAVLAGGEGAVLSHASAAALWEIRYSASEYIDVSVRRSGRTKRAGLRIHRPRTLTPDETTTERGIPVTTPARTILDMAARLTDSRLEHLLDQAEIQELTDYPTLDALARAHATHRGATRLREDPTRLRERPRARRAPRERRLPHPPLHRPPSGEPTAHRRGGDRNPPRRPPRRVA
jgi:hypothetical protein